MNEHEDRQLNEGLDALGAADRAAADADFEESIAEDAGAMAALTARLDALATAERSAAPDGLDERVLHTVGEVFAPAPIRFVRSRWVIAASSVAAAAAVVGGVWMTQRSAPTDRYDIELATLEEDVEILLDLYETDVWGGALAEVKSEAERVEDGLDTPWSAYDDVADSFEMGASS
ncbi:MAG: hypothetical protein RIB60_08765 [Phycisphaerales bacterium]